MSANFDLLVCPSQIFDVSIFPISSQIPRPVQPLSSTFTKWVRYKPLRREFRTLPIPTRQSCPPYIHFPYHAYWHWFHLVQNVQLQIRYPCPDYDGIFFRYFLRQYLVVHMYCGLSNPIHGNQLRILIPVSFEPRSQTDHLQRHPPQHPHPQRHSSS